MALLGTLCQLITEYVKWLLQLTSGACAKKKLAKETFGKVSSKKMDHER